MDSTQYPKSWRLAAIMVSLCLGTLLVAIDNTIIGIAIPQISTEFDALDDIGWYGSAYLLTVTALQPTFGNIYKHFDIKITYIVSVIVFEGKKERAFQIPRVPDGRTQWDQSSAQRPRIPILSSLAELWPVPVPLAFSKVPW